MGWAESRFFKLTRRSQPQDAEADGHKRNVRKSELLKVKKNLTACTALWPAGRADQSGVTQQQVDKAACRVRSSVAGVKSRRALQRPAAERGNSPRSMQEREPRVDRALAREHDWPSTNRFGRAEGGSGQQ
ncbi:uncharacterized protein THITE_2112552 [Thermothielavioides terrestris NRRL 8126]|uniref:Uncharacterized protein n=1 Tax=Thermothielavioides terrestris (strain ATCC 38088 / NRRL 8126) TaxID=578455 RepID=G2QZG7_THETT|nr:uncharacterized protein THITE_2112552 [Thermothielavioides terrestris NRRL 8126]AEO65493.1 hypothetical protein THITE_2112552 [Thermothielavioides terrestris NRRL 8126]